MKIINNFKRPKNPGMKNKNKWTSGCMMVKLWKNKVMKNIVEQPENSRLAGNFLITITDDRKQQNDIFDMLKENNCQLKILYSERIYISRIREKQRHLKQADNETNWHHKTLQEFLIIYSPQKKEMILEGRPKKQKEINSKEHGKYRANGNFH